VCTKNDTPITMTNSLTLGAIVPEFSKFSKEDGKTTLEHVGQFILQYDEASANNTLKLRMFPLLALFLLSLLLLLLILYLLGLN
jgi:hypothetical protein